FRRLSTKLVGASALFASLTMLNSTAHNSIKILLTSHRLCHFCCCVPVMGVGQFKAISMGPVMRFPMPASRAGRKGKLDLADVTFVVLSPILALFLCASSSRQFSLVELANYSLLEIASLSL